MGLAYKLYQHLAIESMNYYRDKGKEVDRNRKKEEAIRRNQEIESYINYKDADKQWENMFQEVWDSGQTRNKSKVG